LESRHINVQCERAIIQGGKAGQDLRGGDRGTRADLNSERVLRSRGKRIILDWLGKTEAVNIFLAHGEEDLLQGYANAAIENKPSMRAYLPAWKEAIGS